MLLHLIKLLTEETSKLLKAGFLLIKICLNIVLSVWLYRQIIGPFDYLNITDFNAMAEFVINGRLFICISLMLLSYIVLFHLLPMLTSLPFTFFGNIIDPKPRIDKTEGKLLSWMFRKLKMLDISNKGRSIKLMENADEHYEMSVVISNKEAKKEIRKLKQSFIEQLGHTYLVFALLYFTIFSVSGNLLLNNLIVGLGILTLIAYYGLSGLFDLFSKSAKTLIRIIDEARYKERVVEIIQEHGIILHEAPADAKYFDKQFYFENREIVIKYLPLDHLIRASLIERLIKKAERDDKILLLVSTNQISSDAELLANSHDNQIVYLQFNALEELDTKLKTLLTTRFALTV